MAMSSRAAARAWAAFSAAVAAACALSGCEASAQPIHHRTIHHRASPAILALVGSWKATTDSKVTIRTKVRTYRLTDWIVVADDGTFTDSYQMILPIGQERIPELFTFRGSGRVEWLGGNRYRFQRVTAYKPGTLTASWDFAARLSVNFKKLFTSARKLTEVFHR